MVFQCLDTMELWNRRLFWGLMLTWSIVGKIKSETKCCNSDNFTESRLLLVYSNYTSRLSVQCDHDPPRWFHLHPNGEQEIITASNFTSTKHSVEGGNALRLNLTNVSIADEGSYGCDGETKFCLYVYSRAVFASCPTELHGCDDEVQVNVSSTSNTVILDASVVYIPHYNSTCSGQQCLQYVLLRRDGSTIISYVCNDCQCLSPQLSYYNGESDSVTMSTGDSRHDFIFTLTNVTASGTYEVVVEGNDPGGSSSFVSITKRFHVNIIPVSVNPSSTGIFPSSTSPVVRSSDDQGITSTQPTAAMKPSPAAHPATTTNDIVLSTNGILSSTDYITSSFRSILPSTNGTSPTTKSLGPSTPNAVNTTSTLTSSSQVLTLDLPSSVTPENHGTKYVIIIGGIAGLFLAVVAILVPVIVVTCWKAGRLKSHGDNSESSSDGTGNHTCCSAEVEIIAFPYPWTIVTGVQPHDTVMPAPSGDAETASHNSVVFLPDECFNSHQMLV